MSVFIPTDRDRQLLQWMLDQERQRTQNTRNRNYRPPEDQPSSGGYIALTPPDGIPAFGSGPPLEFTGTGTSDVDNPGYADCTVYQTVDVGSGTYAPDLYSANFTVQVLNLSSTTIPGMTWVFIQQDKWGNWWVVLNTAVGGLQINDGFVTDYNVTQLQLTTGTWLGPGVWERPLRLEPPSTGTGGADGNATITFFPAAFDCAGYVSADDGHGSGLQEFSGQKYFTDKIIFLGRIANPGTGDWTYAYWQLNEGEMNQYIIFDTEPIAGWRLIYDLITGNATFTLQPNTGIGGVAAYGIGGDTGVSGFDGIGNQFEGGICIGIGGGGGFQPLDSTLTAISGAGTTGTGAVVLASALSGGSGTVTSVDVSGGTTGLTTSGGPVATSGTITLAGTLAAANGGTGGDSSAATGYAYVTAGVWSYVAATGMAIGNLVGSGSSSNLLFVDGSGNLGQNPNLTWTTSAGLSVIGGSYQATLGVLSSYAGYFSDGTNTLTLANGTYAVNVIAGHVNAPGTSGNTYKWGAGTSPTSNIATVLGLPLNTYGAGTGRILTDPDDWVLVNIGGTDYKIPVWVV